MRLLLVVLAVLLLTGCQQVRLHYQLNDDGSGALSFERRGPSEVPIRDADTDPNTIAQSNLARFVYSCEGVSAWSQLAGHIDASGMMVITGRVLFDSIDELTIPTIPRLHLVRNEQGFTLKAVDQDAPDIVDPASTDATEIERRIQIARANYQHERPDQLALLSNFELEVSVSAGPITAAKGFAITETQATWATTGADLLQALDSHFANDEQLRQAAARGEDLARKVELRRDAIQFNLIPIPELQLPRSWDPPINYATELAQAKPHQDQVLAIARPQPAAKEPSGHRPVQLVDLMLVGISWSTPTTTRTARNHGIDLAFAAGLSADVIKIEDLHIDHVVTTQGEALSPSPGRTSHRLDTDERLLSFSVPCQPHTLVPPGVRTLTGSFVAVTSAGNATHQLGLITLQP
ncbi:MAG: hypothetical protein PF961_22360, partial [Planctomycetota bacterium]|nr:hypothetical protein [Planctomycetota bacterium]